MTETPRGRAEAYLDLCAERVAPAWIHHYESKVPPQNVINFFDNSVALLIEIDPEVSEAFGYSEPAKFSLTSELLDVLIGKSHREVQRLQQERQLLDEEQKVTELRAKHASKSGPISERIAWLKARRQARKESANHVVEAEPFQNAGEIPLPFDERITGHGHNELAILQAKYDAYMAEKSRLAAEARAAQLAREEQEAAAEERRKIEAELQAKLAEELEHERRAEEARQAKLAEACRIIRLRFDAVLTATAQAVRVMEHRKMQEARAARERENARLAEELEARRIAEQVEKDARDQRFRDAVKEVLAADQQLSHPSGAVRRAVLDDITHFIAGRIADLWPHHGGQYLDGHLRDLVLRTVEALTQEVNLADPEWETRSAAGVVTRVDVKQLLNDRYAEALNDSLIRQASMHFTYEQHQAWQVGDLELLVVEAIRVFGVLLQQKSERAEELRRANALAAARERAEQARLALELAEAVKSLSAWQNLHPAPPVAPYGVSHQGAERWCCEWLTHMGLQNADVTQQSSDGGIDVDSPTHVTQVKHYAGSVAIAEIRELAGVAAVEGKTAIFMTSGKYPAQAELFADRASMLLFHYSVETGRVTGHTESSRIALVKGFLPVSTT